VIVFEPFYENYGPDAILCGARPVYVPMPVDAPLDLDRLAAAFSDRTRAIVVNTPNNPTGRVLTRAELEGIAALCLRHGAWAITDEIYEHIRFRGEHLCLAALPGMRERTVVVSGASKTFSITGWRIGWIVAPREATAAIRKVHDFLTVGAPAPLQDAVATALDDLPRAYYDDLSAGYRARRDLLCGALQRCGFRLTPPDGAYYVLADHSAIADEPDPEFAVRLVKEAGVATVPASSFFRAPDPGRRMIRFAFCKTEDVLREAIGRLERFTGR
jgi:aminotransferase